MCLLSSTFVAEAQRPLGVDVSSYELSTINWNSVKSSGVVFGWTKATEGVGYTDADFATNEFKAKAAGVLLGGYHFARYDLNPGTTGATNEAQWYWSVAKNYITNGGYYLMPMLDAEYVTTNGYDPGHFGYTKTTFSQWLDAWAAVIVSNAAAKGVIVKPVLYCGVSFSATWMDSSVATNFTPWIANWNGKDPQEGAPSGTGPFATWTFWQYSATNTVPGISGQCDVDVFNGDATGLTNYIIGGVGPPLLVNQPSSRFSDRGGSLGMRIWALGSGVMKYQWRQNGGAVSGATNSTFSLTNLQTSSAGSYTVICSNTFGVTTSAVATVTVNGPYAPVFSDNFDVNTSSSWTVTKSSTDTRSIFSYDYSVIGVPSAPNSTNGTTKGLRLEANLKNGVVAALNASPNGQIFSAPYRLHFDMWINVNGPLPGGGTGSTEMVTAGVGTAGGHTQWNNSGSTADGIWFTVDGDGGVANGSTSQGDFVAYIAANQQAVTSNVYAASASRTNARSSVDYYYANVFPAGTTPPTFQQANYAQQTGSLKTGTVGLAWRDVIINNDSTNVSWYLDGLKIATVPASSITASNIFVGFWDPFASVSDNTNLSFGLIDNVRVEVPVVAPLITGQPTSVTVVQTSNAIFSVTATGSPPPTYIWRFNGTAITGATASSYTNSNAQTSDAGSYSVIVANVGGTNTSSTAFLTVNVPAAINTPPQSLAVTQSSNATFSVVASGTAPLSYRWRFNGGDISGATTSTFTRTNAQPADAGSYSVLVTNIAGSASSGNAILTVNVRPFISGQPQDVTVNPTSNAVFTVTASGTDPLSYQWLFNTVAIGGATASTYTRSNVQSNDAGSYSATVTNIAGAITSASAVLSVNQAPIIATQPSSQTIGKNADATFSVTANGTSPLSYQWRFNAASISGATASVYSRSHVQASDVGSYSVVVTNIAGTVTSDDATLTLSPCSIHLLNIVSNFDGSLALTWSTDTGNAYTLQTKDNLSDAQWTMFGTYVADNSILTVSLARTNAQKFYRLASDCTQSETAGFVELSLPGNSDSYVSVPFVRTPAASGSVGTVVGTVISADLQYPATWDSNQFVYSPGTQSNNYYVRFISGAAQGPIYPVLANGTNSLSVDTSANSLANVGPGDLLVVEPYWTLNSIFPNGASVNASPTIGNRNTEILIPDYTNSGINLSASKIYFFNSGIWKQVGQGNIDHGDDVLQPNTQFIVRHNVLTNTTLLTLGAADSSPWAIPLRTPNGEAGDKQDNAVALARPIAISLDASGLIDSGAFAASSLPGSRTDELLIFDNTVAAKNKSSSAVYYYWSNAWRRVGAGSSIVGSDLVFTPGAGVIIRKGTNIVAPVWTNTPIY